MDGPKSWSIHTRSEITAKYEILERVGSGAYSDVYRARRRSDGASVALKEVHDYQSAIREVEALTLLRDHPNVVTLHEHFWGNDEDAVLVLEFLRTDLASVIAEANDGIALGQVKTWVFQILAGVDACHRNMVVHRDLKPQNLLIAGDGTLKLADFGQARILMEPEYVATGEIPLLDVPPHETPSDSKTSNQESKADEYLRVLEEVKARDSENEETNVYDGEASLPATCTTSDDPFKYNDADEIDNDNEKNEGCLTSCVGTRWYRAPELLFGSTDYGLEIDLWSLGCIIAELFSLRPLFPGTSDIDQLSKIIAVLGNLTEKVWPGCVNLPDYRLISFNKVENPTGLESCIPDFTPRAVSLVKQLVCYDPVCRTAVAEMMGDGFFSEEPLPVPLSELRVPLTKFEQDDGSRGPMCDYDSDLDDFGSATFNATNSDFSIRFL